MPCGRELLKDCRHSGGRPILNYGFDGRAELVVVREKSRCARLNGKFPCLSIVTAGTDLNGMLSA